MRPALLTPATAVILLTAVPAHAASQSVPRIPPRTERMPGIVNIHVDNRAPQVRREIDETRERIAQGEANGQLSRREAKALRREARQISALADRYGRDGITAAEQQELDMRARALQSFADAKRFTPAGYTP